MKVLAATVVAGNVVSEPLTHIADGTCVYNVVDEESSAARMSADELAKLEAEIREADPGETIPGDTFLDSLRRFG